jgi:hypothetical protein
MWVVLDLLGCNPPALAVHLNHETCRRHDLSGDEAIAGCNQAIRAGWFNLKVAMGKLTSGATCAGASNFCQIAFHYPEFSRRGL